ncbi:MAG: hypothetical protein SVY15_03870 [Halobacteriota archaeon]|nr:hypothetical protein [Halobacteriota archaeon]MDY6959376.1 hypothetical protein [Halobacteriota archaeon]
MVNMLKKTASVAVIISLIMALTLISGCADRGTDTNMDSEVEGMDQLTTGDIHGNDTINSTEVDGVSDTVGSVTKDELDNLKQDLEEMEFEDPGGLTED